jgi:ribosomal protein S13
LNKANEVRLRRARFKRDVKKGLIDVREVIAAPPEWARTMSVPEVLGAIQGIGDARVKGWLDAAQIPAQARLGKLTPSQRTRLAELVGYRPPKHRVSVVECSPGKPVDCAGCGTRLRRRVPDGLCGFCRVEQAAA